MKRFLLCVMAAGALAACSETTTGGVAPGEWGGQNMDLVVAATGATAAFKCGATGTIDGPIRLENGSFDVLGTYTPLLVQGGPRAARYHGSVSGGTMTVELEIAGQPSGTFQLEKGHAAQMDVCNF